MTLLLESALASWLRTIPELEGLAIHTGQSNEEIPGDQPALIAACGQIEAVGTTLHKASVTILLSTPAHLELDQHRTLASALRAAVYNPTGLADGMPEDITLAGASLITWQESQADQRWACTANLLLGVAQI